MAMIASVIALSSGLRQVADEGAIHLERVDGKALEVRERRVAHAEVVDGKPRAIFLSSASTLPARSAFWITMLSVSSSSNSSASSRSL